MSMKYTLFAFFLALTSCHGKEQIFLYTFYTTSHETLLTNWFLPSLQDDYEITVKYVEQTCPSGTYMEHGWLTTMLCKIDMIIEAIKSHWGNIIFYADVDVQFFQPTAPTLYALLEQNDFVIQQDNVAGRVCAGVFALRANANTAAFFRTIRNVMIREKQSDNPAMETLLRKEHYPIAWDYLPISFFSTGALGTKTFSKPTCWQEGDTLQLPDSIILHHANFTKTVDNKIKLLAYVKDLQSKR